MEELYTVRKNRWGADWGSDFELLITKFRLKLKKVEKTMRPFRYDLNQIPYNYTVEMTNRFKVSDLTDRVPEWIEVNWTWNNRLIQNWERSTSRLHIVILPINFICRVHYVKMLGWMKHKLEPRLPGETSITSDMQMTPLMTESEKELKSLLMKRKRRVKILP